MRKFGAVALAAIFLSSSAPAAVQSFPAEFKTETVATNGARIYVRVGGNGPAVVLLHGYGERATCGRRSLDGSRATIR